MELELICRFDNIAVQWECIPRRDHVENLDETLMNATRVVVIELLAVAQKQILLWSGLLCANKDSICIDEKIETLF